MPAGATTTAVEVALTRPYASVVMTGIAVLDPTEAAPGPVDGNANVTAPVAAETVMLPVPELDNPVTPLFVIVTAVVEPVVVWLLKLIPVPAVVFTVVTARKPLSNTDPAYNAPVIPVPPSTCNCPVVVDVLAVAPITAIAVLAL